VTLKDCSDTHALQTADHNSATLTITHSTVTGNQADGEIAGYGGGINTPGVLLPSAAVFHSWNTIIAGNRASTVGQDVEGPLGSLGHNLIGDSFVTEDPTDLVGVDPRLGPLQDNGGPTPTRALLPGSPAIDAGDNTDAPEWDQRGEGFRRIVNNVIDIGAFEAQEADFQSPATRPLTTAIVRSGFLRAPSWSGRAERGGRGDRINFIP